MFRAHVLIIRKSRLYYTASGVITPIPIGVMIPNTVGLRCGAVARCALCVGMCCGAVARCVCGSTEMIGHQNGNNNFVFHVYFILHTKSMHIKCFDFA